ncbi:MAG: putative peptidoglycan glycosyltransferase FtsW [Ignavibacteriaceae bacterium]
MKKLGLTIFLDSFALMLLGLIIVMSASSTYSAIRFDSLFHLFNSHLFKVMFGILVMIIFCAVPYELYKEFSKPAILLVSGLLILTLFIAPNIKGAGRWINLGFLSFQPADIAKLVLIVHLAALIEDKGELIKNYKEGFLYLMIWVLLVSGLILIQPNVSNGVLLVFISFVMLYIGGAKLTHLLGTAFICLITVGAVTMLFTHSRERILTFIDAINNGGTANIQVKQALLGLGSGGIFGVGVGHSMQSNLFLPESYGDFIFAIVGEELGFIGSVIVLMSYLVLFVAGILIAKKTKDVFGQMLAFGITFSILLYAFINAAVATGLVPTTGLPLPFISYGGTSMIFLCISVGILVNIAYTNARKNDEINSSAAGLTTEEINQ